MECSDPFNSFETGQGGRTTDKPPRWASLLGDGARWRATRMWAENGYSPSLSSKTLIMKTLNSDNLTKLTVTLSVFRISI
jgi:hypothetical protein